MFVKLSDGREIPMEMHKVRIVQQTQLVPIEQRLKAIEDAGYNTFLLRTKDIFMDMLTDSGTNAMSDNQLGAMMVADDAYAGSESFFKVKDSVKEIFSCEYVLPVHQGRAAENILSKFFVKPGSIIPMNYHFTTTKAHLVLDGATVIELCSDEAIITKSNNPFKGNMDLVKLEKAIKKYGAGNIPFIRMEATTNLIGGQPFSLKNLSDVKDMAEKHGIPLVLDASLISENAFMIHERENKFKNRNIKEIIREMIDLCDIVYLSARKSCMARGGLICTNSRKFYEGMRPLIPLYEGFLTYGGISTKELEAMAVGIREMCDINVAGASVEMIRYFVGRLEGNGVPVVTPAGGLAAHIDATKFVSHLNSFDYPAGSLAAAIYIASGVRSMERGTLSMDRDTKGNEVASDIELARLAVPRRVFTMSQIEYVVDRLTWLFKNRELIGGLTFVEEPPVLRFFFGRLSTKGNWSSRLALAFEEEFGKEL